MRKFLILLSIFLLLLFSFKSEISLTLLSHQALKDASRITNRKIINTPTVIVLYDKTKFAGIACHTINYHDCSAIAVYIFKTQTIFIDGNYVDLNTIEGQGVLVHEMVHHLQRNIEYTDETCASVEREAYNAENQFLKEHNLSLKQQDIELRIHESCSVSFSTNN